jgi:hypothetical protein
VGFGNWYLLSIASTPITSSHFIPTHFSARLLLIGIKLNFYWGLQHESTYVFNFIDTLDDLKCSFK